MNKDYKKFENDKFIYPKAKGIYSAREYNFYSTEKMKYAVSSYYKDREEGVMIVGENTELIVSESGYVHSPVSVKYNNDIILFWAEYCEHWIVKTNFPDSVPELPGDTFVISACIDNTGSIYLACEHSNGYLNSDIYILHYINGKWLIHKNLNKINKFCKRPRICTFENNIYVVWDAYFEGKYDIYFNIMKNNEFSGEKNVTVSSSWDLKPSISIDKQGTLWICWLRNEDVERNGVISKVNSIMMTKIEDENVIPITGSAKNTDCIIDLNMGLLPKDRYFGYHGLRRNPQICCFKNGNIGLFWEQQRDETEVWDNVENGYFLCMIFNGVSWSRPNLIHDGGNSFAIDSNAIIENILNYAYRGARGTGSDIKFASIKLSEINEIVIQKFTDWDDWKSVEFNNRKAITDLYWGDLHCHSIYSPDAEGYPDELLFYARDRSGLDFCGITDNDIYGENILTKSALRYILSICECLSKPNTFLAYTGYEWTYHKDGLCEPQNFNHRTILFLDNEIKIASRADESGESEPEFKSTLNDSNTMWHAHHGIWEILDSDHDMNTEVVSSWDNNMIKFNTVNEQLSKGHVFGFMGGSDNHRFVPGHGGALTGVIADELTRESLKAAFKMRHNYATCGSKTYVEFGINEYIMGDIINENMKNGLEMSIQVRSHNNIEIITIIRNSEKYNSYDINQTECNFKILLPKETENVYYYLIIKLDGVYEEFPHNINKKIGNYIYTSPIWIRNGEKL